MLCDVVSPERPNLDPAATSSAASRPRTRAVIAVHICGYPADLGPLRELCDAHGLALIEDAAQALGAEAEPGRQAGTVGRLGCLSFFSKKQLCVGEGGMVLTADEELAATRPLLRIARHDVRHVGPPPRPRGLLRRGRRRASTSASTSRAPRSGLARLPRLRDDDRAPPRGRPRYREALADTPGLTLMWTDDDVARSSHFAFPVLFESGEARRARARRCCTRTRHPDDPLPGAAHAHRVTRR